MEAAIKEPRIKQNFLVCLFVCLFCLFACSLLLLYQGLRDCKIALTEINSTTGEKEEKA